MNRTPVSSSNIASIGFDEATSVLEVEFLAGSIYQYFDVPLAYYEGLLTASSVGGYFNTNIKNSFAYSRL